MFTFPHSIVGQPYTAATWEICRGETWEDAYELGEGGKPLSLIGKSLEMVIRPDYEHPTLIRRLTSLGTNPDIVIDNAEAGSFYIFIEHGTVDARFRAGTWTHVFRLREDAVSGAPVTRILTRGPFIVHPARFGS